MILSVEAGKASPPPFPSLSAVRRAPADKNAVDELQGQVLEGRLLRPGSDRLDLGDSLPHLALRVQAYELGHVLDRFEPSARGVVVYLGPNPFLRQIAWTKL